MKERFMGRDDLLERINQVKLWDVCTFGETQAKKSIIEPILDRLGWDTSNPNEVVLEYSTTSGDRADYALFRGSDPLVLIEAKKPGESLDNPHYIEQILKYAFQKGVPLAILSNGIEWWFYLPLEEGDWQTRKFYSVDLNTQPAESACERLIEFLNKNNVMSGSAVKNAKEKRQSTERRLKIQNALPEVWKSIITEPNKVLIDLLIDETERECGFKPDESTVKSFIAELIHTVTPEKSGKEKEGKAPKSKNAAKGDKPKIRSPRNGTIDSVTIKLLEEGPKTLEEIQEAVVKQFPGHDADKLRDTTKRRLHGYLKWKYGVEIYKDENGKYSIK